MSKNNKQVNFKVNVDEHLGERLTEESATFTSKFALSVEYIKLGELL